MKNCCTKMLWLCGFFSNFAANFYMICYGIISMAN